MLIRQFKKTHLKDKLLIRTLGKLKGLKILNGQIISPQSDPDASVIISSGVGIPPTAISETDSPVTLDSLAIDYLFSIGITIESQTSNFSLVERRSGFDPLSSAAASDEPWRANQMQSPTDKFGNTSDPFYNIDHTEMTPQWYQQQQQAATQATADPIKVTADLINLKTGKL